MPTTEQPTTEMREYRCRACGWFLFESDAGFGRVRMTCPNRRCDTRQVVYLGGRQSRAGADVRPDPPRTTATRLTATLQTVGSSR